MGVVVLFVIPVGVTFGKLFDDEEGQQFFEAIVGTLRAAKKRGVVYFKGQVRKGFSDWAESFLDRFVVESRRGRINS